MALFSGHLKSIKSNGRSMAPSGYKANHGQAQFWTLESMCATFGSINMITGSHEGHAYC